MSRHYLLIKLHIAIFVMRLYSISQDYLNARRVLVMVTAVSHILIVVFDIIGIIQAVRTYSIYKHF